MTGILISSNKLIIQIPPWAFYSLKIRQIDRNLFT